MQLKLKTQRHLINWPRNYSIPDSAIIDIVQPTLIVDNNPVQNSAVTYSTVRTQLSTTKDQKPNQITLVASYLDQTTAVNINVDLVEPGLADWQPTPDMVAQNQTNTTPKRDQNMSKHQATYHNQPRKRSNHRFLKILIVIVLIILGITACQAHNAHEQQAKQDQARQEQQAYKNGQRDQENKDLKSQVNDLQKAVAQYKKNQDQTALNNKLDQIIAHSNYDTVKQAADQIRNNPGQAQQALNQLNDSVNGLQHVVNQLTNWLAINGYSF